MHLVSFVGDISDKSVEISFHGTLTYRKLLSTIYGPSDGILTGRLAMSSSNMETMEASRNMAPPQAAKPNLADQ